MWNIIPRDKVFYDLFERSARNVVHGAELLAAVTNDWSQLKKVTDEIKDAEHEGDQIAHEALTRLNRTFVTPLDREDIFALICGMDDIIDATDAAAKRLVLYELTGPNEDLVKLARTLVDATKSLANAVTGLRNIRRNAQTLQHDCIEVHRLENEGDVFHNQALTHLFAQESNPISVIKWKEIYEIVESAIDYCEDVANTISGLVLKHA
jgi:hypothetical protein